MVIEKKEVQEFSRRWVYFSNQHKSKEGHNLINVDTFIRTFIPSLPDRWKAALNYTGRKDRLKLLKLLDEEGLQQIDGQVHFMDVICLFGARIIEAKDPSEKGAKCTDIPGSNQMLTSIQQEVFRSHPILKKNKYYEFTLAECFYAHRVQAQFYKRRVRNSTIVGAKAFNEKKQERRVSRNVKRKKTKPAKQKSQR